MNNEIIVQFACLFAIAVSQHSGRKVQNEVQVQFLHTSEHVCNNACNIITDLRMVEAKSRTA